MTYSSPTSDDRPLWDLHLSGFAFPAVTAADELGIFDDLAVTPAAADEVAARLNLNRRAIRALLPVLASAGLLVQLLDDSRDGPPTATAFSLYMLLGTKGQQFTA